MTGEQQQQQQQPPQAERPQAERRQKNVPELLLGLWLPTLVAALIFGTQSVTIGVLLFGGLLALLLFGHPSTARNLREVFRHREAVSAISLLVPAMFMVGIFSDGNTATMLTTLGLFALGVVMAALRGEALFSFGLGPAPLGQTAPAPAPLPEQAADERLPMPDLRELCRGLPAALSGEVMQTVEQLEEVAVQARQSGDTRRTFDAEQALSDYLPQTVRAWKGQSDENRNPDELLDALAQVRAIAGSSTDQSETARQEWEIQQRFLESRSSEALKVN